MQLQSYPSISDGRVEATLTRLRTLADEGIEIGEEALVAEVSNNKHYVPRMLCYAGPLFERCLAGYQRADGKLVGLPPRETLQRSNPLSNCCVKGH